MAKIAYINTEEDGICYWQQGKGFVPLKDLVAYYENVAAKLGIKLFEDEDEEECDRRK